MDDTVFEIKPTLAQKQDKNKTPYRWRSCFASEEEYAQYLSDIITPGMTVRCCKAFEGVSIISKNLKNRYILYRLPTDYILCFLFIETT